MKKQATRSLPAVLAALATIFSSSAQAQSGGGTPSDRVAERAALTERTQLQRHLEGLRLPEPLSVHTDADSVIDPALRDASGMQQVIVRLRGASVAELGNVPPAERKAHKQRLQQDQEAFLQRASRAAPHSHAISRVQNVINAVFLELDASEIDALAADSSVYSIHRVRDYQLDLSETVPYIGAEAVQGLMLDGTGVRVAVLDSGIDYTHLALGGPGTLEAYEAAYGTDPSADANKTRDGLFPTAKVVDGYDFVGEDWLGGANTPPLAPDEDPIDFEGHGTHVADIIGGAQGVAPGVELIAVKTCAAQSSACSGIALIQGMEFAVDPNGDGDFDDAVDIINMSLGSPYGQPFDDDLAVAVDGASALGVLTVASAGNSGDKPYANGTPAAAATALSVAQTQVPSAQLPFLTVGGEDYSAVFQPWSVEPASKLSGELQYGDGNGGNLNGCAPFAAGSLDGFAVLVDRGACNFTLKISNISQAGGTIGIIGLIAPGAPFAGADGGDRPIDIPGYMVDQATSLALQAAVGQTLSVDPENALPLVGQMVGSSSRGPQHEVTTLIKPEIGAPGGSVSAIAGTGTGTGPFGGTSGAAPMVSGAAALLLQSEPTLSPAEAKARLMTNAETEITTDPFSGPAPITRIGGGEVRADRAVENTVAAWDADTLQGALSFGFVDVDREVVTLNKIVNLRNYGSTPREFTITPEFRFDDDAASGAVTVSVARSKVRVGGGKTARVPVKLTIDGSALPANAMNSGSDGANPATLTFNEFDGYLLFEGGDQPMRMAWHVLPRKAAWVKGRSRLTFVPDGTDRIGLRNLGMGTAQNDAYSLIALSDNLPEGGLGQGAPTPDIRAVGVNTFPVPAGFCSGSPSFLWAFAINTWERQQHLLPVSHQVAFDINRDGIDDYVLLNRDASGPTTISDGRQLSWVLDLETGGLSAFFFAEHATNTGNTVLLACAEQLGLSGADLLTTPVDINVTAQDFYFGGPGDVVENLTVTPLGERYVGSAEDIPAGGTGLLEVIDFGSFPDNTPELGLLLLTNGDRGPGARGGATQDTEALIFRAK